MAVPKGFKNNININVGKIGPERRKEILDGIADKGTYLPRGVSEEDIEDMKFQLTRTNINGGKRVSLRTRKNRTRKNRTRK